MRTKAFDKAKKKRRGVHSKKRTSSSKTSKFYQKNIEDKENSCFFYGFLLIYSLYLRLWRIKINVHPHQ